MEYDRNRNEQSIDTFGSLDRNTTGKDWMVRNKIHVVMDRLWKHSSRSERVMVGVALMLTGASLSHIHIGAPEVVQEAFAWSIHGLGFERLISLIPE